jgi:hypothetical protein
MKYEEYYQQSRAYNWNDMRQLRSQSKPPSTTVPEAFKHRFSDPAEYDAWVAEERKRYFA